LVLLIFNDEEVMSVTCPKWFYETPYQPTSNGIPCGMPKIVETKKPNRINQLGYIDGGGGGI
jgi:hypothetical protein